MPRITTSQLYGFAKDNRRKMTFSEKQLWTALRDRRLGGMKFRREHVIPPFIVDFYCPSQHLIVEVDGDVHDSPEVKEHDLSRQAALESAGYRVLRFSNEEIVGNLGRVTEKILAACRKT